MRRRCGCWYSVQDGPHLDLLLQIAKPILPRPLQLAAPTGNLESCQLSLLPIPLAQSHSPEHTLNLLLFHRHLIVPPLHHLLPTTLLILRDNPFARKIPEGLSHILPGGTRTGDRAATELNRERVLLIFVVDLGYPVGVGIAGEDDCIRDLVVGQDLEGAVARSGVTTSPRVKVVAERGVEGGEKELLTEDAPCRLRGRELSVEPRFLAMAEDRAGSFVLDVLDVAGVPVQIRDAAIVIACIQHDQIDQPTDLEGSPNAEVIIHLDLSHWHPFEIRANGVHLDLVNRDSAAGEEAFFRVVHVGHAAPVGVVADFVVVPGGDVGVGGHGEGLVGVGAVLRMSGAVVVQGSEAFVRRVDAVDAVPPTVPAFRVFVYEIFDQVSRSSERVIGGDAPPRWTT